MWIAGSLHREGRRSPAERAALSELAGFLHAVGSGIRRLRKFPIPVPSQRRTTKPGKRDSGHQRAGFSRKRVSVFGSGIRSSEICRGAPAGVTGERDFRPGPPPGSLGSGIFLCRDRSLAFQRSCGSLGPFTEKDDEARGAGFPRQGHQRAGFSEAGFQYLGAGFALRNFLLAGERDSPAGVTGERDFRPGPPPGRGKRVFLSALSESSLAF